MSFAAITAGANSWLTKPFQPEQLTGIISIMCEGR
jgi:DNA-binding response OmpR family regulator